MNENELSEIVAKIKSCFIENMKKDSEILKNKDVLISSMNKNHYRENFVGKRGGLTPIDDNADVHIAIPVMNAGKRCLRKVLENNGLLDNKYFNMAFACISENKTPYSFLNRKYVEALYCTIHADLKNLNNIDCIICKFADIVMSDFYRLLLKAYKLND